MGREIEGAVSRCGVAVLRSYILDGMARSGKLASTRSTPPMWCAEGQGRASASPSAPGVPSAMIDGCGGRCGGAAGIGDARLRPLQRR